MTQAEPVRYHLRDITNRRAVGEFGSDAAALAALKGGPDGHFSVNNHGGDWCEVLVRGGDLYVRHALMAGGVPVGYTSTDARG
jgi:hypothetical protein